MEKSKKPQQDFFLVIVLAVVALGGLTGLANIRVGPTFTTILHRIRDAILATTLNGIRDALLTTLQIVAILLLLSLIIMIFRWLARKREGTVILPFTIIAGDDKDHKDKYNGKSISDSLTVELLRIFQIHEKEKEEIENENEIKTNNPWIAQSPAIAPPKDGMDGEKKLKPLQAVSRTKVNPVADGRKLKINAESLNPNFADVTINVGGVTVSITQLLITLKKLLTDRDPESVISGSLQRFEALARLVVHLERRGERTLIWEVSREINSNDEILNIVKDLAFKMWKDITRDSSAKTWKGLKHFTEALDGYHEYRLTGRDKDLERAMNNCLAAALAEQRYKNLFRVCYKLGNTYFDKGGFENAEKLFECAIGIHIDATLEPEAYDLVADAFNGYGASLAHQKKYAEAESAFRQAIKLKSKYLQAYVNLSFALAELGQAAEAKATIIKARDLNLLESIPQSVLGDLYSSMGFQDEAIETYSHAVEADPKDGDPHHKLGNLYTDLGKTDEAIAEYQRAIELDPGNALYHNDLGLIYADLGRIDEAIAEYRRAIELDPEVAYPHNNLGLIYAGLGRADEAIAEYRRATEIDQKFTASRINLGMIYSDLGRINDAIAEYQRAIELDPDNAYPHQALGDLYVYLGRSDDAIDEYQRAQNPSAYSMLGYIYRDLGRNDEAIDAYQRAIELAPGIADFHIGLGGVYRRLKHYDVAIAVYQRAIEINDQNPLARASLAACYRKLSRDAEYAREIEIAQKSQYDWTGNEYNHACFQALCGNVDEALKLLQEALEKKLQTPDYAQRDIDFDFIREDPRFQTMTESDNRIHSTSIV